jgi:hypothetical protein
MKRKQMVLVTLAAVAAALVGGMLGGWLFAPLPVQAQGGPSYSKELDVEVLRLVDENGKVTGYLDAYGLLFGNEENGYIELTTHEGNPALRFTDDNTAVRAALGLFEDTAALGFFDSSGELIWGAP